MSELPDPKDQEAVLAYLSRRVEEMHVMLTGQRPPGSLITTPADEKPAQLNFANLLSLLAQQELNTMYLARRMNALESAISHLRFTLRGFSE